jgi:hypothetical protein
MLAAPEQFGWGAVGGAIFAVLLYVVPELSRDLASKTAYLTVRKFVVMVGLVVLLSAVAGALALIPAHTPTRGQAIEAGLAVQAIMRGILAAFQQGLTKVDSPVAESGPES